MQQEYESSTRSCNSLNKSLWHQLSSPPLKAANSFLMGWEVSPELQNTNTQHPQKDSKHTPNMVPRGGDVPFKVEVMLQETLELK